MGERAGEEREEPGRGDGRNADSAAQNEKTAPKGGVSSIRTHGGDSSAMIISEQKKPDCL